MNKKTKITIGVAAIVLFGGLLSSCNSFCSNVDISHFLYAYDPLNNVYFNNTEDAYDYMEYTFKGQKDYNEGYYYTNDRIYFIGEDGKEYQVASHEDEVFKTYGNLTYIKPGNYFLKKASTSTDLSGNYNNISYVFGLNSFTKTINTTASAQGIILPSFSFFERADQILLDTMIDNISMYNDFGFEEHINLTSVKNITIENVTYEDLYGYTQKEYFNYLETKENAEILLGKESTNEGRKSIDGENVLIRVGGRNYSLTNNLGYLKFYNEENPKDYFENIRVISDKIALEIGIDQVVTENYLTLYKQNLEIKVNAVKTCITKEQGFYGYIKGNDGLNETVSIEAKASNFWNDWGKAFTKHGFLEGLLVYPISYLVDTFAHSFGMNGWGQIFSVLLVTVIVRILFMAITLPSTISQQKQQALQPELAKLQQKYPNSNTNDYEKQRLAQAQMALYKKHKVHPFLSLLTMIVQFPLFICVWNALAGSAALSSDAVLGLRLSDTIWNVLSSFSGWPGNPGWWTALVLILLMSGGQILSMLIPQWLNKKRMKSIEKTHANPTADSQAKTMKFVQWFMIIFTIILGFTLPSAMGVYWLAGSIFNILQSVIMHFIFTKKKEK